MTSERRPENPILLNGTAYSEITLRDLFAAAALTGMTGNKALAAVALDLNPEGPTALMAALAYAYADAMLQARAEAPDDASAVVPCDCGPLYDPDRPARSAP